LYWRESEPDSAIPRALLSLSGPPIYHYLVGDSGRGQGSISVLDVPCAYGLYQKTS
jgi:hypothetical protein